MLPSPFCLALVLAMYTTFPLPVKTQTPTACIVICNYLHKPPLEYFHLFIIIIIIIIIVISYINMTNTLCMTVILLLHNYYDTVVHHHDNVFVHDHAVYM